MLYNLHRLSHNQQGKQLTVKLIFQLQNPGPALKSFRWPASKEHKSTDNKSCQPITNQSKKWKEMQSQGG